MVRNGGIRTKVVTTSGARIGIMAAVVKWEVEGGTTRTNKLSLVTSSSSSFGGPHGESVPGTDLSYFTPRFNPCRR